MSRDIDAVRKAIRGLPRGEILGARVPGDRATELIADLSMASCFEATSEELIRTGHARRTMLECEHWASLVGEGRMINS